MERRAPTWSDPVRHLVGDVTRMGGLAESLVSDAVDAATRRDVGLARTLVARDLRLDSMEREIEQRAIVLIAGGALDPCDLRKAVAALKLAANLERCGDLARNIAQRSLVLSVADPIVPLMRSVERLGRLAAGRLNEAVEAYVAESPELALRVWRRDAEVDEHYESLFRDVLAFMARDPAGITVGAHLLFIVKNFERIGDHATNIAEVVHYQVTGDEIVGQRPKRSALSGDITAVRP